MRPFVVFVALAGLAVGIRLALPMLDTRPEQDACSFGPVSNADYRGLLRKAHEQAGREWIPFNGSSREIAKSIERRIELVNRNADTFYHRLAGMHAVLRQLGENYERIGAITLPEEYPSLNERQNSVLFQYNIDVAHFFPSVHLHSLEPIVRIAAVNIRYTFRPYRLSPNPVDRFSVNILWPNYLENNVRATPSRVHPNCPPTPTKEWVSGLQSLLKAEGIKK